MITLPFPPSGLSGHNVTGNRWAKNKIVKQWRELACTVARAAKLISPEAGDIRIHVRFVPPNRRGDRVNFPNRMKPIFDGIADALNVNDSRFLPSFEFSEPEAPGRVEVTFP